MYSKIKYYSLIILFFALTPWLLSQNTQEVTPWYYRMPNDTLAATGIDSAKEMLQNIAPEKVTVAIIDAGVDINHVELKDQLWTNEQEIPNNDQDDDDNGYVDDIHGWNFLGNKEGENLQGARYEYVRLYDTLRHRFDTITTDSYLKSNRLYRLYQEVKAKKEEEIKHYNEILEYYNKILESYKKADKILKKHFEKQDYDLQDIKNINADRPDLKWAKNFFIKTTSRDLKQSKVESRVRVIQSILNTKLNPDYRPRRLIGDDPGNIMDSIYGNNNYGGGTSSHGTAAAGIIAAADNEIGITGIAPKAEIMAIRAVPGGDEWDKDIALAIRYAVNQGANIISGSFSKMYSPQKELVDSAIRYAEKHDVLIITGAGNDQKNNDIHPGYPNAFNSGGIRSGNFISVGASSRDSLKYLAAGFSNYGKKMVDIFAPGVDIPALKSGNGYRNFSGTSAATPVTTGIATLLKSHYPRLSANKIREILVQTATDYSGQKVLIPGSQDIYKPFSFFCRANGIINAANAVKKIKELYRKSKLYDSVQNTESNNR